MCLPFFFEGVVCWVLALCFYGYRLFLGCDRKLLLFGTFCLLLFGRKVRFLCSQSTISGLGNCCFANSYFWFLKPESIQGFGCCVLILFSVLIAKFNSRVYADPGLSWSPSLWYGFMHHPQLRVLSLGPGMVSVLACNFGASGLSLHLPNTLPYSGLLSWFGFILGCSGFFFWAASKWGGAAVNFWHIFGPVMFYLASPLSKFFIVTAGLICVKLKPIVSGKCVAEFGLLGFTLGLDKRYSLFLCYCNGPSHGLVFVKVEGPFCLALYVIEVVAGLVCSIVLEKDIIPTSIFYFSSYSMVFVFCLMSPKHVLGV